METIQHADGRVELNANALESIKTSPLYNEDLAPVPIEKRNWTTYNYAALWISMAHCIPTYMMASGLISAGMNWWQALITILLGNVIVLAPILLNSHPGTKYGIPFPVFARASYGTIGSNLPALMRAIVACGWFGIQAWIGGQAIHIFLGSIIPNWNTILGAAIGGHTPTEWISFLIFWAMNIAIVYRGMNLLRHVENWAAPFVLIMTAILLVWILYQAGGIGFLLHEPEKFQTAGEFWKIFIPSLTAMIGFWATLSLNMPDFTRFGKSQREQVVGQTVALPTTMVLFAAMGILITSAAVVVFPNMKPDELWDPVKLVGQFSQPLVVAISMFTIIVATLSVNIAANVVSPANDFANAFPKWISFRTGGLITGIVGILMQPWKLLADPSGYIFSWLLGYSGGLGSIAGVLIADYWFVRNKNLNLGDLYRTKGIYGGWNGRAVVATILGCSLALSLWIIQGLQYLLSLVEISFNWLDTITPIAKLIFDYAWFVGFGVSFVVHFVLMKAFPPREI